MWNWLSKGEVEGQGHHMHICSLESDQGFQDLCSAQPAQVYMASLQNSPPRETGNLCCVKEE